MWMAEKLGTCINTNRTDEALTKGASRIAVGCHFCHIMLSDGLTQTQSETSVHEDVEVIEGWPLCFSPRCAAAATTPRKPRSRKWPNLGSAGSKLDVGSASSRDKVW